MGSFGEAKISEFLQTLRIEINNVDMGMFALAFPDEYRGARCQAGFDTATDFGFSLLPGHGARFYQCQ